MKFGRKAVIVVAGLTLCGIVGSKAMRSAEPRQGAASATGADHSKSYQLNSDRPQFGFFDLDGGHDQAGWGAAAKAAVQARLGDPYHAKFGAFFAVGDKQIGKVFPIIVCGKVSAKNSSGEFTGDDPFVYYPAADVLTIEKHTAIDEWNSYCAGPHLDPENVSARATNELLSK